MIRLSTTETRMNRRIQIHNMMMTLSNKEAMWQWMTPGHMMNEQKMIRELNRWNLLQSLHDQMCHQPPRYCRHVAELLLYLIPYLITLLII
jgi:hypothetical protein